MAIPFPLADRLADLTSSLSLSGRCLTLGRQDIQISIEQFRHLRERYNLRSAPESPGRRANVYGQELAAADTAFFYSLGFDALRSVDVSDAEQPTDLIDLNGLGLAAATGGEFNLVLDGGTLEHCFHLPNAMRNIVEATAIDGLIVHQSPTNNYVEHGFFQFSPTFFSDYYQANGFEVMEAKIFCHTKNVHGDPWRHLN